jgi:hypothetical protein
MPRTSDETLGRRRFQLLTEQAVEDAIEKMRQAQAAELHTLSHADYLFLQEILGDLWINLEREKWEKYSFSGLTRQDIHELIALGKKVRDHPMAGAVVEKMDAILSRPRQAHAPE